jgi:hypothetical protein
MQGTHRLWYKKGWLHGVRAGYVQGLHGVLADAQRPPGRLARPDIHNIRNAAGNRGRGALTCNSNGNMPSILTDRSRNQEISFKERFITVFILDHINHSR